MKSAKPTRLSQWLVIDGPHNPTKLHLYANNSDGPKGSREWRLPAGDEVNLPKCKKCLELEALGR